MKFPSLICKQGPCVLHLLAAAFFLFNTTHSLFDFPLDDSWIHRVYARSFAWGQGLAYNTGQLEAGSTSPLWSILTAPVHWGELLWGAGGVVVLVKILGVGLGCIAIQCGMRLVEKSFASSGMALMAGLLWAMNPRFVFSSLSGMENNLLLALWLAGTLLFVNQHYTASFLFFSLMPLARPESVLIVPLSLGAYLLIEWERLNRQRLFAYAALLVVPFLLWVLFCLRVTGHPLPNTFYVKAVAGGLDMRGWITARWILFSQGFLVSPLLWGFGVAGLIFAAVKIKWRRKVFVTLILVPLAALLYFFATVFSREMYPVGYYWSRWMDPPALLFSGLICAGLCFLFSLVMRQRPSLKKTGVLALLSAAVFLGVLPFSLSVAERRRVYAQDCRAVYVLDVLPGKWVATHTSEQDAVATDDAGAVRYFSGRHVLDLHGLNSKEIAFHDPLPRVQWLVMLAVSGVPPGGLAEEVKRFSVPAEEYSICGVPEQGEVIIYRVLDKTSIHRKDDHPPR